MNPGGALNAESANQNPLQTQTVQMANGEIRRNVITIDTMMIISGVTLRWDLMNFTPQNFQLI
jgi:hypothetical protein